MQLRNYTRWREGTPGHLHADILGGRLDITVQPDLNAVVINGQPHTPDEARMYGVRLIDAAVLADGDRAIRRTPTTH